MRIANMHAAKSQLSNLIEAALNGEEVIIARNGTPVVRLEPVRPVASGKTPYEQLAGLYRGRIVERNPDWWKSDQTLDALFNDGPLFPPEAET